ncbi:uncharacterized protein NPIL_278671 [Nephila pilipes]|uniref:Uncharacterized protein n=1 Tax=Nephila pilipes TaxID=299642 RepID=A0A8X6TVM2_NEPPI|nr:uncharacterized protein NPIL_278671 [Nephila pilipes]
MSRKYLEQMMEEIEFSNYQRCLQANNSMSHSTSSMHPEFRNFSFSSRYDGFSRNCYVPPCWLLSNLAKPNSESVYLVKKNEQYAFLKNYYGNRHMSKENEFHHGRWSGRSDRNFSSDVFSQSARRCFMNWNGIPSYNKFKENFDDGRVFKRSSRYVKSDSGPFQRYNEERLDSTDSITRKVKKASFENLSASQSNTSLPPNEDRERTLEDIKTSSTNNLNSQPSDTAINTPSPELNSGYASWYYAEEQQQIVNMLREVNMRHERQLRRDMAARTDRPCSDDSITSNTDPNSSDGLQRSLSSDDEDDGIVVLVSPEGENSATDTLDPDDAKDLDNDYLEKSVSDYFEEFQSIFTVSPEKNIINNLTKECMKESLAVTDSNKANRIQEEGRVDKSNATEELSVKSEPKSNDSNDRTTEESTLEVEIATRVTKMGDKGQDIVNAALPKPAGEQEKGLGELFCEIDGGNDTAIERKKQTSSDNFISVSNSSPKISSTKSYSEVFSKGEKCFVETTCLDVPDASSKHLHRKLGIDPKRNSPSSRNNYQPSTNYGHNTAHSDIMKLVNELSKKNKFFSFCVNNPSQSANNSHFHPSQHVPENKQENVFNSIKDFIQACIPIDNFLKNNNISIEHETDNFQLRRSNEGNKNPELSFWKKLPHFIQRTGIPERKEVRSEIALSARDKIKYQTNVELTSFSDTCLPFKSKGMNYRRISVDELFQLAKEANNNINTKDPVNIQQNNVNTECISGEHRNLISATDHLKQILKIGKETESQKCSSASGKYHENDFCPTEVVSDVTSSVNKIPVVSNSNSSFKKCDGGIEKDSGLKSTIAVKYYQNSCKIQNNSHNQDEFGNLKTKVTRMEDQNSISNSRQNNRSSFSSKIDYSRKGYKQEKFNKFQQREILPENPASRPNNKKKSNNIVADSCKTENLPSKNLSKDYTEEKPKSKRRKKYKSEKSKVKDDTLKTDVSLCVNNDYRDKRNLKDKSVYSTYNTEVGIEKLAYINKDKYRTSWKDVRRTDGLITSSFKKELNKLNDIESLNNIKVKQIACVPVNATKLDRCNHCKHAGASKSVATDHLKKGKQNSVTAKHSNSDESTACSIDEVYEDKIIYEPLATQVSTKELTLENKSTRSAELNPHFHYSKSKNIERTQSTERRTLRKEKNYRIGNHSVKSYNNSGSSKYDASPSKLWHQGNNSRYEHSYRNHHERACFERDRLSKSKRSDYKLKTDYRATCEKDSEVSLIDKEQCRRREKAFTTDKGSYYHKDSKSSSTSKTKSVLVTELKEKLVLESIYSYHKVIEPREENNIVISTKNLSTVVKEDNIKEVGISPDKDRRKDRFFDNCDESIKENEKESAKRMLTLESMSSVSMVKDDTDPVISEKANLIYKTCSNNDSNCSSLKYTEDSSSSYENKINEINHEKLDNISTIDSKVGENSIINQADEFIITSHNILQNDSCLVKEENSEITPIEEECGALANSKQIEGHQKIPRNPEETLEHCLTYLIKKHIDIQYSSGLNDKDFTKLPTNANSIETERNLNKMVDFESEKRNATPSATEGEISQSLKATNINYVSYNNHSCDINDELNTSNQTEFNQPLVSSQASTEQLTENPFQEGFDSSVSAFSTSINQISTKLLQNSFPSLTQVDGALATHTFSILKEKEPEPVSDIKLKGDDKIDQNVSKQKNSCYVENVFIDTISEIDPSSHSNVSRPTDAVCDKTIEEAKLFPLHQETEYKMKMERITKLNCKPNFPISDGSSNFITPDVFEKCYPLLSESDIKFDETPNICNKTTTSELPEQELHLSTRQIVLSKSNPSRETFHMETDLTCDSILNQSIQDSNERNKIDNHFNDDNTSKTQIQLSNFQITNGPTETEKIMRRNIYLKEENNKINEPFALNKESDVETFKDKTTAIKSFLPIPNREQNLFHEMKSYPFPKIIADTTKINFQDIDICPETILKGGNELEFSYRLNEAELENEVNVAMEPQFSAVE